MSYTLLHENMMIIMTKSLYGFLGKFLSSLHHERSKWYTQQCRSSTLVHDLKKLVEQAKRLKLYGIIGMGYEDKKMWGALLQSQYKRKKRCSIVSCRVCIKTKERYLEKRRETIGIKGILWNMRGDTLSSCFCVCSSNRALFFFSSLLLYYCNKSLHKTFSWEISSVVVVVVMKKKR